MVLQSSSSPSIAIIVMDASIKNNIAISISHVHLVDHLLTKRVHHATFVTSTEVELFVIRCGINQACNKENMSKIIITTNSIHTARKIFDSKSHPYQIHTIAILSELHHFFAISQENSIKFLRYSSYLNVVATNRHSRTNDLTTSKALSRLSSNEWGNYKRTRQGALTALLLYIYYYIVVRTTTICLPHVHPPCFYLMSYYSSIYVFLKATMLLTCVLTSYL